MSYNDYEINTEGLPEKLSKGDTFICSYSGTYKAITLPAGLYKLECWGAEGGIGSYSTNGQAGKGGYSYGTLRLKAQTTLYLYVGGQGGNGSTSATGGFNGGGDVTYSASVENDCGAGGGATHIATKMGLLKTLSNSVSDILLVAGGGGGAGWNWTPIGGYGGGAVGGNGSSTTNGTYGSGGTQSAGGAAASSSPSSGSTTAGSFGQGGSGAGNGDGGAGGGGGFYGGGGGTVSAGGGGSGYINTSKLLDGTTVGGNIVIPQKGKNNYKTATGNSGDGGIRISILSLAGEFSKRNAKTWNLTTISNLNPENLGTGDIINCPYSGTSKTITLPPGKYQFECWGAQGGYRSSSTYGGKGGYIKGTKTFKTNTKLFLYTGGSGNTGGTSGGFNGGGKRRTYNGGGGASDIRLGTDSLYARVLVAGGGGSDGASTKKGMYGGGPTGGSSTESFGSGGYGGGQEGVSNSSWQTTSQSTSTTTQADAYAGFGFGGNGIYRSNGYGGAGGGGWYGGSGAYPDGSGDDDRGGGGGSNYIYNQACSSSYPSGCLLQSSDYLDEDFSSQPGNTAFLSPTGASETGHSGNGYIRITVLQIDYWIIYDGDDVINEGLVYNELENRYETTPVQNSTSKYGRYCLGFRALKNLHLVIYSKINYSGNLTTYSENDSTYIGSFGYNIVQNVTLSTLNSFQYNFASSKYNDTYLECADFYIKKGDVFSIWQFLQKLNENSSISDIFVSYTIEYEELDYTPIEIPLYYVSKTYTGKAIDFATEIIGDSSVKAVDYLVYYQIGGGTTNATDAGTYYTTLTLNDKNNYKWISFEGNEMIITSDDQTITWYIYADEEYIWLENLTAIYPGLNQIKYHYLGNKINLLPQLINNTNSTNEYVIDNDTENEIFSFNIPEEDIGANLSFEVTNHSETNYSYQRASIDLEVIDKDYIKFLNKNNYIIIPYTGKKQIIRLPKGRYRLECYGAIGGYNPVSLAALQNLGGQSIGEIVLNRTTTLYCYAGGSGLIGGTSGGFNGGGKSPTMDGGGGASDIRIGFDSLYARVIVAGGGGSDGEINSNQNKYSNRMAGGHGGGLTGGNGQSYSGIGYGYGGDQTGAVDSKKIKENPSDSMLTVEDTYPGFGFGGNGNLHHQDSYGTSTGNSAGAGGGGWYGGAGCYSYYNGDNGSGGGGSGYVYTSETSMNYPVGCLLTPEYYLSNASTTENINDKDGYIKITRLDIETSKDKYIKNNNQWKMIQNIYIKVDGKWKLCNDNFFFKKNGGWTGNE